jgi:hypothetical protein
MEIKEDVPLDCISSILGPEYISKLKQLNVELLRNNISNTEVIHGTSCPTERASLALLQFQSCGILFAETENIKFTGRQDVYTAIRHSLRLWCDREYVEYLNTMLFNNPEFPKSITDLRQSWESTSKFYGQYNAVRTSSCIGLSNAITKGIFLLTNC